MMNTTKATKPLFIYGTRHGSIYNLTPSNMPPIAAVSLSFGDFFDSQQMLNKLPEGMSLKKFLNYPQQTITYVTPYDFYKEACLTGCQNSKHIKVKCNKGYTIIDAPTYDRMIDLIKPDMVVALTEYPALEKDHKGDSNKSHKRAILKTKTYYEYSSLMKGQKKPFVFGPVHGGKNLSLLSRSLQDNLSNNTDGLVVCDLCDNETLEQRQTVYNFINKRLQQSEKKYRLCLSGQGKIQDITHALKFGYEVFEVNYPFTLAQQQKALVYHQKDNSYEVRQPKKAEELMPLGQNCQCYACKVHNESYIAHLIDCFEMNAKVLLTIHNMEVYRTFLDSISSKMIQQSH